MTGQMIAPVYKAVFAVLGDLRWNGRALRVHETVPARPTFPFLTFAVSFAPQSQNTSEGALQVDIWHSGKTEDVVELLDVVARLDHKRMPTAIGRADLLLSSTPEIGRDPKTGRRHGVQIFRVLIHS